MQFEDAALAARRATRQAARVLLLVRERVGVSKEKHELRFVRKRLRERETAAYLRGMGAAEVTPEDADRALEGSIALVRRVLERFGLSPELVKYDGS